MQNSQISQDIVKRFHDALARIINEKKIRGKQTFTTKYNIDKRSLYLSCSDLRSGAFEIGWMTYLVNDYNVSADWLLTGKGSFYAPQKQTEKAKCCAKFVHKDIINV